MVLFLCGLPESKYKPWTCKASVRASIVHGDYPIDFLTACWAYAELKHIFTKVVSQMKRWRDLIFFFQLNLKVLSYKSNLVTFLLMLVRQLCCGRWHSATVPAQELRSFWICSYLNTPPALSFTQLLLAWSDPG